MDGAEDFGQQAVAGHGHEDPRLAEKQHQQHAGHARQAADGDQGRGHPQRGAVFQGRLFTEGHGDGRLHVDAADRASCR